MLQQEKSESICIFSAFHGQIQSANQIFLFSRDSGISLAIIDVFRDLVWQQQTASSHSELRNIPLRDKLRSTLTAPGTVNKSISLKDCTEASRHLTNREVQLTFLIPIMI
ncbi:hypothetical protein Ciccas_005332 [Cichlidogyrus casuarinus]|uniref:Uncharacterized protein n=1 Tax=Cichlidogyrus casuarinus TaxID=1844966 RepID=A0ABD2Q8Z9_9PLAT